MDSNYYSVDELLAWMLDNSRTLGWGAIVAYDQLRANRLLVQGYILRFGSNSYLPLINQKMESGEYSTEYLTNLKLSVPRLAFPNADLEDSNATLTMDFLGGTIMTVLNIAGGIPRIDRILKVLPVGGPQLTMEIDLKRLSGTVGDVGQVVLNIAEGEVFKANFVLGDLSQEMVGARFKLLFEELDDDQKVFPLGELVGDLNGPLTPETFEIRTMPAPGATLLSADNYGDGAVLLFVRLKGGTGGNYPGANSGFKYLIPADKNGQEYSGTVLLASKVLAINLFKPHIESEIGKGISLMPSTDSSDKAIALSATAGSWTLGKMSLVKQSNPFLSAESHEELVFDFSRDEPLTFTVAAGGLLRVTWKQAKSFMFNFVRQDMGWDPEEEDSLVHFTHSMEFFLKASIDQATGVVTFVPASAVSSTVTVEKAKGDIDLYYTFKDDMLGSVTRLLDDMYAQLSSMALPEVDTFLIRNLLFPGQNALRLREGFVPGDLALFGHIDPLRTSVAISPLQVNLMPGGTQKFTLQPAVSGATWSVEGELEETDVGTIDASGVYKAPAASSLKEGYRTVRVTGKGKLNGQDVTASALVSVMESSISVSPTFKVCGTEGKVTLTAGIMDGGNPAWSLKDPTLGGELSTTAGAECVYTAGPRSPTRKGMYIEAVQVKNAAANETVEALLLVLNTKINTQVTISADSKPETGKVQLQVEGKNGPINPPANAICELLVSGGGTLSSAGVFTEPANAKGFAVVSIVVPSDFEDHSGFIVLPLPLSTYADISRRVSDSIRARAIGFPPAHP
ncbi:hypothetical protein [Pseudomonas huaxiensis]|uniref:hypothetical protein n=1 Tax=Pseudomonas huaxiensis TaxID=2213017 RepID=UPI000DA6D6D3|nr:hypothetical protein [Pseudomonas huaxiensis]